MNDFSNERTVKAANITSSATESAIRTLFEFLGPVTNLQLQDSPYNDGSREATVEFQEHEAAMTALHLSGTELGDRILVISFHSRVAEDPSTTTATTTTGTEAAAAAAGTTGNNNVKDRSTVLVYHLAPATTVAELSLLFAACGAITKMSLDPDVKDRPNLRAVVDFATAQGADAAIRLDGQTLRDKSVRIRRGEPLQHQDGKTGETKRERSQSSTDRAKNDTRRSSRERRESPTRRRSRSRDRHYSSRRRSRSNERYSRRGTRSSRSRDRDRYSRRRSRSTDRYSSRRRSRSRDRYASRRKSRSTERDRHSRRSPSNDKERDVARKSKSDEPTRERSSGDANHNSSERTRSKDNWPEHDTRDGRRSSRHRSYYR